MSGEVTVGVRVRGRVQGVWFRGWTMEEARARGLAGWVKNEPDGSVSALLSGPGEAVEAMVAALRSGPPLARVETVETFAADAPGAAGFHVLR